MKVFCCWRLILFCWLLMSWPIEASSQSVDWIRQLAPNVFEESNGVSADGLGNVYISGYTLGPNTGARDAFLSKYNALGSLEWTRQLDMTSHDFSYGVSADGVGNIYISGSTLTAPGVPSTDAFISKYTATGDLEWTRQLGSNLGDISHGVSADRGGNVYITGLTQGDLDGPSRGGTDAFVSKYTAAGNLEWTRQLGSASSDIAHGISADREGNVYISGYTGGSLSGSTFGSLDAFVGKYDASGNLLWTTQLGTSARDISYGVSADGLGNVYISGFTEGNFGDTRVGGRDVFLSKLDSTGSVQWTRQLGTTSDDESFGVSADQLGNVYLTGHTYGSLGGPIGGGIDAPDAFVAKYDASGNLKWKQQLTNDQWDSSRGISHDSEGRVYISGYTEGSLGAPNAGATDAFVAKIIDGGFQPPPGNRIEPIPAPPARNLIVITHGWAGINADDDEQRAWMRQMETAIENKIAASDLPDKDQWVVETYDWTRSSGNPRHNDTGFNRPTRAFNNAWDNGRDQGQQWAKEEYQHVHLIGHSAGAAFIAAAANEIQWYNNLRGEPDGTSVHLTFLDPYTPISPDAFVPDVTWADNYFVMDRSDLFLSLTSQPLNNAHNVQLALLAYSGHSGPIGFYRDSVMNLIPSGPNYGYIRSVEASGWNERNSYPLGNVPPVCLGAFCASSDVYAQGPMQPISVLDFVTSTTGVATIGQDNVFLKTGSPVWTILTLDITQAGTNLLSFELQFTSELGAEGLLSVILDGVVIANIDERFVENVNRPFNYAFEPISAGQHYLAFRLDSFTSVTSEVSIRNITTGVAFVPEPATFSLLLSSSAILVWRRRSQRSAADTLDAMCAR